MSQTFGSYNLEDFLTALINWLFRLLLILLMLLLTPSVHNNNNQHVVSPTSSSPAGLGHPATNTIAHSNWLHLDNITPTIINNYPVSQSALHKWINCHSHP
ncbi:hypothetical protein AWENTII_002821 [Aspergillus wentii]